MRVLVLCDRPPRPDPAVLLAQRELDAVLLLGDLQTSWLEGIADARLPKLGVYGNHDEHDYLPGLGAEDLHLRAVHLDQGTFAGFEGCVRYQPRGARQYSQRQAERMVRRLPAADVLLCHCPPLGVNDDPDDAAHIGFRALLGWVERHRPRYLLHGHTHPAPGRLVRRVGDTEVIYVAGLREVVLDL